MDSLRYRVSISPESLELTWRTDEVCAVLSSFPCRLSLLKLKHQRVLFSDMKWVESWLSRRSLMFLRQNRLTPTAVEGKRGAVLLLQLTRMGFRLRVARSTPRSLELGVDHWTEVEKTLLRPFKSQSVVKSHIRLVEGWQRIASRPEDRVAHSPINVLCCRKEEKRRKIQENRRLRSIQDNQQKRSSIISKQDVCSIRDDAFDDLNCFCRFSRAPMTTICP